MNKVIALDFDGVIADSEHECYIISIAAFHRIGEKIEEDKRLRNEFRKGRAYVKNANDYYVTLKILQNPKASFDAISFSEFAMEREKHREKEKGFHEIFYEERERLQKNMQEWIKLNPPFECVPEILKRTMASFSLAIVTSKDKKATKILLESYGLKIGEENILSKEFSMDKKDQMKFIANKFNVGFNQIVFVEDNLEQLLTVKELGVNLIIASWGYNTAEQRKEAEKLGIAVATRENFEEIINNI